MAADKEIMRKIETLRLDRPGRSYQAAIRVDDTGALGGLGAALAELAQTYRDEAELWAKSGAKGWKGSEAESYLIAQAIDTVAAQLDNAGGGAALSVSTSSPDMGEALGVTVDQFIDGAVDSFRQRIESVGQAEPATTHERLNTLVSAAVAEGRGMLRDVCANCKTLTAAPGSDVCVDCERRAALGNPGGSVVLEIGGNDVTAYLKGDVDTLPGLAEALVPGSIPRMAEAGNPFDVAPCCEHMLTPDEDPAPWCDCRSDDDMARGHAGPCKRQAHLRAHHNTPAEDIADADGYAKVRGPADTSGIDAETRAKLDSLKDHPFSMPITWESDTMTADGLRKPGLAPTLGQPGDNSGGGYSHAYVPPGARKLTFADLLQPVAAASLPPHLSHSQGNTISDCPAKYRMQRVDLLPQIPQWANIGGTATHSAIEAIEQTMVNAAQAGRPLKLDGYDVELGWKEHFEATISAVAAATTVPRSVWRSSRKGAEGEAWWWVNGPKFLRAYLDARPDEPSLMTGMAAAPAIEWEVTTDVPTGYGPVQFTAKIDRVTYDERTGGYVIRDYKTSYERPTDTTQLGDYAHVLILAKQIFADRPILGSYFDARRGTWTEPIDLLAAHPFEAFQYRVTTAHAQKRALTTGPTPARPSSFCGGCSVRYACPIMATKA
jgi:hypothetical protein